MLRSLSDFNRRVAANNAVKDQQRRIQQEEQNRRARIQAQFNQLQEQDRQREKQAKRLQGLPLDEQVVPLIRAGDSAGLAGAQLALNRETQALAQQDRDRAIQILLERLNGVNPFEQQVQNSLSNSLSNPDVLSEQDLERLRGQFESLNARGLQDTLGQISNDFNARGLSGSGILQAQQRNEKNEGLRRVFDNIGNLELQRALLRGENLSRTQQLGAGLASDIGNRQTQLTSILAELLGTSQRQLDDFSGFAALAEQKRNRDETRLKDLFNQLNESSQQTNTQLAGLLPLLVTLGAFQ